MHLSCAYNRCMAVLIRHLGQTNQTCSRWAAGRCAHCNANKSRPSFRERFPHSDPIASIFAFHVDGPSDSNRVRIIQVSDGRGREGQRTLRQQTGVLYCAFEERQQESIFFCSLGVCNGEGLPLRQRHEAQQRTRTHLDSQRG
jgi:hypothetical protein